MGLVVGHGEDDIALVGTVGKQRGIAHRRHDARDTAVAGLRVGAGNVSVVHQPFRLGKVVHGADDTARAGGLDGETGVVGAVGHLDGLLQGFAVREADDATDAEAGSAVLGIHRVRHVEGRVALEVLRRTRGRRRGIHRTDRSADDEPDIVGAAVIDQRRVTVQVLQGGLGGIANHATQGDESLGGGLQDHLASDGQVLDGGTLDGAEQTGDRTAVRGRNRDLEVVHRMVSAIENAREGIAGDGVGRSNGSVPDGRPLLAFQIQVGQEFHFAGVVEPAADGQAVVDRGRESLELGDIRDTADILFRFLGRGEGQTGHDPEFAGLEGTGGHRVLHQSPFRIQQVDLVAGGIGAGRHRDVDDDRFAGEGLADVDLDFLGSLGIGQRSERAGRVVDGEVTADLFLGEPLDGYLFQGSRRLTRDRKLDQGGQGLEGKVFPAFGIPVKRQVEIVHRPRGRQGHRSGVLVQIGREDRFIGC